MAKIFKEIAPEQIPDNLFQLIGNDWFLLTAGPVDSYNTMTANWGGIGLFWFKKVCWVVVRPSRYTYEFMEREDAFTMSFFTEDHREALNICGTKSGRDIDKAAVTGLTPVGGKLPRTTYFEQARIVIECRKIYFQDIDPSHFLDDSIAESYQNGDYHRLYIGEIASVRME
jgi:flavin reductase (DIM6/NTAB) family NADH-FMN oxidoreductase RutF